MRVLSSINHLNRNLLLTSKARTWKRFSVAALAEADLEEILVVETEDALAVVPAGEIGDKAVAKIHLKAGTLINEFVAPVLTAPTMHTVQLCERVHVAPTRGAEFISHACTNTNTRIMVDSENYVGRFFVTRDVEAGEDLSFNYNTTEWDMNSPFACSCESCRATNSKHIRGFKHLSLEERIAIIDETSPLIRAKAMAECLGHLQSLYNIEKDGSYFDLKE
mmetsp:Transcript_15203/g.18809  ORF Transcript_15203/g.18809 Transcript_15203/m.18809 type:complete len:221 (+) Transcript_15203:471-1133(+)|eukprot:CAMPEP_0204827502 /NCGR_PEP_ID=MMETSP1346-20131115/4945_1 /ASSEMBLY_ACC=CAM_ASM_000771 /TAXON_ID=215587 /ORGANISM="Aplanochytrium stocchinoi, Strain GSBS06" /LENGTH=220 /DNA_ID=CAMNT_0051955945 /DNA_START=404 /DNA_END=1066 /DNA_ORIENTATION=-